MLDADPAKLTKTGSITITDGRIDIEGFEGDGTSCRDVAVLAMCWAIGKLQADLLATIERPGGGICAVN
ncbi:MAG: hypothetical protein KGH65_05650 [Candidatus Micrarchaeota archaeon]|nr:hypothetical protein [Candidatus Micrarchaeota archaeon]